jgi:hypothetical protein
MHRNFSRHDKQSWQSMCQTVEMGQIEELPGIMKFPHSANLVGTSCDEGKCRSIGTKPKFWLSAIVSGKS